MAWTDRAGSADAAAVAQISAALGVDPDDRIEDVEREIVDGPNLPRSRWQAVAARARYRQQVRSGPGGPAARSARLIRRAQVDEYLSVFLTDDREPRKSVLTKKFADNNPALARLFEPEADRIGPLIERRRAVTTRDRTQALLYIATARRRELPAREARTRPARL